MFKYLLTACLFAAGTLFAADKETSHMEQCAADLLTERILDPDIEIPTIGPVFQVEGNLISFHDGLVTIEKDEIPILGNLDTAKYTIAAVVDFTCEHCKALTRAIGQIQYNHSDEMAVILLPGTRGTPKSRDVQHLVNLAFRANHEVYQILANSLYLGQMEAELDEIESYLLTAWGKKKFKAYQDRYAEPCMDVLHRVRMVMEGNAARKGSMNLPQLIIGDLVHLGATDQLAPYYQLLETHLGLQPRYPKLRPLGEGFELGRMFAGNMVGLEIPLVNIGQAPLALTHMVLPTNSIIRAYPRAPVPPGDQDKIQVGLKIPEEPGPFNMVLDLRLNTLEGRLEIKVNGTSWRPLTVNPMNPTFKAGESASLAVLLQSSASVKLGNPTVNHPSLTAELRETLPNRRYELVVHYNAAMGSPQNDAIFLDVQEKEPGDPWPPRIGVPVNFIHPEPETGLPPIYFDATR